MQKKFVKNLALILFLNFLVKPFWILGVDRQVQNVVGPDEYGFYTAILSFSFLFFIFLDLGITNFNNRNIAQNTQLLQKHLAGIGTLKLLLGFLYAIIIIGIGIIWGYKGRELYLLAWVGFNQFLLSFILYLRSNISGLLLFKTDSFLSVLDRVLMIVIVGIMIWTGWFSMEFTIEWFVYAQTVAYFITALIALVAVLRQSGKLHLNWNPVFFLAIIKNSMPFALLVLLMSFYNRIDPVLIKKLLPIESADYQAGVYAQAFRLLDAGQNFAFLFSVLLLPIFSKLIKEKKPIDQIVRLSFSILVTGAIIIAITSSFFSKEIMGLMYNRFATESASEFALRISQSSYIMSILMFSFVAISSNYIFGTLLTANKSLKNLNIIAFAGLLMNISVNIILIPKFMATGSAWASLIAQGGTAVLQLLLAVKVFKFKPDYLLVAKFIALIFVLTSVGWLMKNIINADWMLSALILISIGLIFSFVISLLDVKGLINILKSEEV
jgi:O-antigen/teichoic acid export membrane protein